MLLVKLLTVSARFNLSEELDTNVLDVHKIQELKSVRSKEHSEWNHFGTAASMFMIGVRDTSNHSENVCPHTGQGVSR